MKPTDSALLVHTPYIALRPIDELPSRVLGGSRLDASSVGRLQETSNCYCHPGRAGGSPGYARLIDIKPFLACFVEERQARQCTQELRSHYAAGREEFGHFGFGRHCLPRFESIGLLTRERSPQSLTAGSGLHCRRSKILPHAQIRAQLSGTSIEVMPR
jgi:hypothetical protein